MSFSRWLFRHEHNPCRNSNYVNNFLCAEKPCANSNSYNASWRSVNWSSKTTKTPWGRNYTVEIFSICSGSMKIIGTKSINGELVSNIHLLQFPFRSLFLHWCSHYTIPRATRGRGKMCKRYILCRYVGKITVRLSLYWPWKHPLEIGHTKTRRSLLERNFHITNEIRKEWEGSLQCAGLNRQ